MEELIGLITKAGRLFSEYGGRKLAWVGKLLFAGDDAAAFADLDERINGQMQVRGTLGGREMAGGSSAHLVSASHLVITKSLYFQLCRCGRVSCLPLLNSRKLKRGRSSTLTVAGGSPKDQRQSHDPASI